MHKNNHGCRIDDAGLLYVKKINGVIISHPHDETLPRRQMNEGASSVHLGMNGIPSLAEDLMVVRDIELLNTQDQEYTSVVFPLKKLWIEFAKPRKKEIPVTAGVNPVHLILDILH
jgi:dihydroorotase